MRDRKSGPSNRRWLPSSRRRLPSNRRRLPSNRRRLPSNRRRLPFKCHSIVCLSAVDAEQRDAPQWLAAQGKQAAMERGGGGSLHWKEVVRPGVGQQSARGRRGPSVWGDVVDRKRKPKTVGTAEGHGPEVNDRRRACAACGRCSGHQPPAAHSRCVTFSHFRCGEPPTSRNGCAALPAPGVGGTPRGSLFPSDLGHANADHSPLYPPPPHRDALEGKGPQRRPQRRLGRRLKEVAKTVGGGYCRLHMPSSLALGVRGTVAGHRLGALEGGGGVPPPPSNASLPHPHAHTGGHLLTHLLSLGGASLGGWRGWVLQALHKSEDQGWGQRE